MNQQDALFYINLFL